MIFVINVIKVIHVVSVIIHSRRGVSRRFADGAHNELIGRSREYPEVIIMQIQLRVHEDGQSVGEDPYVAVSINLSGQKRNCDNRAINNKTKNIGVKNHAIKSKSFVEDGAYS